MQAALEYLKQNQKRFLAELVEYLRFPSVSAQSRHKPDMLATANWLAQHCRKIGLTAEVRPTAGHPIVVARTPRQAGTPKPHYVVYGHYDVQPPEPFELWKSPPSRRASSAANSSRAGRRTTRASTLPTSRPSRPAWRRAPNCPAT
jgi:acetylornithine deacetylase/succinyl-diaminopimelate desuccinylase-like protein